LLTPGVRNPSYATAQKILLTLFRSAAITKSEPKLLCSPPLVPAPFSLSLSLSPSLDFKLLHTLKFLFKAQSRSAELFLVKGRRIIQKRRASRRDVISSYNHISKFCVSVTRMRQTLSGFRNVTTVCFKDYEEKYRRATSSVCG